MNASTIKNMARELTRPSTPTNAIISAGLQNILGAAIGGLIFKKFSPAKATFGRGLGAGLYLTAVMTAAGAAAAYFQQQRISAQEKEIQNLWERIGELHEKLNELENDELPEPADSEFDRKVEELEAEDLPYDEFIRRMNKLYDKTLPDQPDEATTSVWHGAL